MKFNQIIFPLLLFPLWSLSQTDTSLSKSANPRYNLSNPIPPNEMKEMETDRPDVTESAYTVAAGHFQVESDLFKYVRNKNAGTINTSHIFNLGNYKLGLSERSDIQFVIPTYISNVMRDAGTDKIITRNGGFDDVILRFKYNFWGYSGGKTAFAILPFASFPTSSFSSNGIQGGVVFPFALKINESLDLGSQVEMDIVRDGNKKYHPEYLYSITFGKSFSSLFSSFTESVVSYSPWSHHTDIFVNGGIIFSLSKNFNIDAGFYYGVNKGADRTIFTGFSFRF